MLERTFKNIDDKLHKDAGCGSELCNLEQTPWVLFFNYIDELEKGKENDRLPSGLEYTRLIEPAHRACHGISTFPINIQSISMVGYTANIQRENMLNELEIKITPKLYYDNRY